MAELVTALNLAGQNAPTDLYNAGAYGSPYTIATSGTQTNLLYPDIDPNLIEAFPAMFTDIGWMLSLPTEPSGFNHIWGEIPYLVSPLIGGTGGAGGASPQVYNLTANTVQFVGLNDKVMFTDQTQGVVIAISGQNVTVRSYDGAALPALAAGEVLADRGPATADGVSDVLSVFDPQIAQYDNILEDVGPVAVRWDPKQMAEYKRNGSTNFIQIKMQEAQKRFLVGFHQTVWMSKRGTTTLTNGQTATATSGILEQQANAGVANQPCTPNTFIDVVRETIFSTALQRQTRRMLCCTSRAWNYISSSASVKAEKIRYTPSDMRWNLNIEGYDFGSHQIYHVPMDQWEDTGSYNTGMRNQAVMLNDSDLSLRHMEGFPMMAPQYELLNREQNPGNLYNFKLVYWVGNVMPILKRAAFTGRFTINGM